MAGETRVLVFAEGVSTSSPEQSFLQTTSFTSYASDAAFVTAKGSAADAGDVYFNTTLSTPRVYTGATWRSVGGLIPWLTGAIYVADDIVHNDNVIYKCLVGHTAGTFSTDLAAGYWVAQGITSSVKQGTPTGAIDGVNDDFTLPTEPVSKASLVMFIDGVACDPAEYTLVGAVVTFVSASIPQVSQSITYYYMENSAPAQPTAGCLETAPWYHQITAGEVSAKGLTLPITPTDGTRVVIDIPSGAPQSYGIDYTVAGDFLDWDGLGMESDVAEGQRIRVLIFN
jgi:hypothetical protein